MEVDLSNKLQIIYILVFLVLGERGLEIIYLYFNIFQKGKSFMIKETFIPN